MSDWDMEPGYCPACDSGDARVFRVDKDVNILVWYECRDCGQIFVECYSMTSKGIPEGLEEE